MRRSLLTLVLLVVAFSPASVWPSVRGPGLVASAVAQDRAARPLLAPARSIGENGVTNLHAEGDSLWVGPLLHLTVDGGASWLQAEADSLSRERGRVFSIDAEGRTVWVGLGYSKEDRRSNGSVSTAAGFLASEDGGASWTYRPPPLDARGDSTVTYGGQTLEALPVVVPEQSPPFDVDVDPASGTVWTAGWASGFRRAEIGAAGWDRIVVPPDTLDHLHPDSSYAFEVGPQRGTAQAANNYLAFSVLVDETGTVWAGSAAGLNRSVGAAHEDPDSLVWDRFTRSNTGGDLPGDWVISVEEQPDPAARNPVWVACWQAGEGDRYGLAVTRDGGATYETVLLGEQIHDVAFRGDTVYAAGERGLFVSSNGGRSWRVRRSFSGPDGELPLRRDLTAFAAATTPSAVWVGTDDGLLRSADGGQTWRLFRTDVPVDPEEPTDAAPSVETYAYPNPYSPQNHGLLRIRYELERAQAVRIRLFDFAMNLVATVLDRRQGAGAHEVVWRGTDRDGRRVANGTYLYAIETDDETLWGKILVAR